MRGRLPFILFQYLVTSVLVSTQFSISSPLFVSAVSIETTTATLCNHVVSVMAIMSLSKKSDNSEGQTQNTV